jgi:hypothetical protein
MSPDDLPDASRLKADLARVEKHLKVPFERFLDEEACRWSPPTPMPADNLVYNWDEPTLSWVPL